MKTTLHAIKYRTIEETGGSIVITARPHKLEEPSDDLILYLQATPFTTFKTPYRGSIVPRRIFDLSSLQHITIKPYWYQTGSMALLGAGDNYYLNPMIEEDEQIIKELFARHL